MNLQPVGRAHDLGYDLLRYRRGAAGVALARSFSAAVRFNSWRQMDGAPIDGSGIPRPVGISLLALLGLGYSALVLGRRWRRWRSSTGPGRSEVQIGWRAPGGDQGNW